ncbi:MAG: hypothetical protein IKI31_02570, partial [Treponema sp.]|nr:hypothetical protein [Treponema sp.]
SLEENAIVTRLGADRFLWNLFCKVTRVDSVKYSKRYKNRERAKSPLKDVPITHEDFDAVIGVVENEIMSLKDGVHFEGEKYVTSEEFYNSVQKIK